MLECVIIGFCIGIASLLALLLGRRQLLLKRCTFDGPFLAPRRGLFRELQQEVLGAPPQPNAALSGELERTESLPCPSAHAPEAPRISNRRSSPVIIANGLVPAADYAWTWAHVDHHLFDAVGQMTHQAVNSLADLGHAIKEWPGVSIWNGPSEQLVHLVKGHLAEWLVANHLTAAGASVAMPEHANQAGWDMVAGAHKLNVKAWSDASSAIHQHFADAGHADIGLVLPADAAHLPHDALHFDASHGIDLSALPDHHGILIDDALSHAQVASDAHDGLDAASGQAHLHLPWITLCFASCREGSLLLNGHTDLLRAGKNVAVTTAAVGAGGAIGAKIGAVVGTLIAPGLGTLLGTAIGGFAGAVTGREYADEVRLRPLHEAKAAYDQAIAEFRQAQSRVVPQADAQWTSFFKATEKWLRQEGLRCEKEAEDALRAARQSLQRAKMLPAEKVKIALDAAENELRPYVEQARAQWLALPVWRRWVWPTQNDLTLCSRYRRLRRDFALWRKERRTLEEHLKRQHRAFIEETLDLMLVARCVRKAAVAYTKRCGIARTGAVAAIEQIRQAAVTRVASARATAVTNLRTQRESITKWVESELSPTISRATQSQNQLLSEMRKAGISADGAS